jgi:hypothetical protein
MPTPTTSVRIDREHHQLIHDIARALKADPAVAESLRAVLAGRNTAAQAGILGRLEEREPRMARLEALEARMAALEERLASLEDRPAMHAAQPAMPAAQRRRPVKIGDDLRRSVHDLRRAGHTRQAIADELEIGAGTVSKILSAPRPD